jgi:acyl-CoA reductase-like NAD-dependent aldehyde dehydrogenase
VAPALAAGCTMVPKPASIDEWLELKYIALGGIDR